MQFTWPTCCMLQKSHSWEENKHATFFNPKLPLPYSFCYSQELMDGNSARPRGGSPALLYSLKDWDLCMQILPSGQGPISLTVSTKHPILCYSNLWICVLLSIPPAAHVCRLLALLSFDLMVSWFKGLSWEKINCVSGREAFSASSALWGGSLLAQTEPDGREWVARDKRGKGAVTLPLRAAHRWLVQLICSLKWHPKP